MQIHFLNVDLEISSESSVQPIIDALGDRVLVLHHDTRNGRHFASFETMEQAEDPEATVVSLCRLVSALPSEARAAWNRCKERTLDIGFEGGDTPKCHRSALSPRTLQLVAELDMALVVSIYPPAPTGPNAA